MYILLQVDKKKYSTANEITINCNMNAFFFPFDLFMVYIPEYKQQLRTKK